MEQGDIFGRIGKNIGQGASEQLERSSLSRGLERIAGNKDLNEIQRYSQLLKLPGGAENASALIPAIQRSQERRSFQDRQEMQPSKAEDLREMSEGPLQEKRLNPDYLSPLSAERIDQETTKRLEQFPTETVEQARAQVKARDIERLQKEQSFENRRDLVDREFEKRVGTALQKEGARQYGDVSGAMKNEFLERIYTDVDSGKLTPYQAAKQASEELLSFAESKQNLRAIGSMDRIFKPSEAKKSIESVRDKYEKFGKLKEFKDDLVSYQGLSEPYADALAYPVRDNKEINNIISGTKSRSGGVLNRAKQSFTNVNEEKIADKIGKHLKPTDSLLSIALSLKGKGFNPTIFMDEIRKDYKEGKISLNDRQVQEFQKAANFSPSLADNFLYAWSGLDPIMEIK